MDPLPHHYAASIDAAADDEHVTVRAQGLPDLETNAPAEYGGPGDRWSPETLLVAAIADCYVLSFRAIARASKLEWQSLTCDVDGTLDKADKVVRFTAINIHARVEVGSDAESLAQRVMQKAKDTCLVTNSLNAEVNFQGEANLTT